MGESTWNVPTNKNWLSVAAVKEGVELAVQGADPPVLFMDLTKADYRIYREGMSMTIRLGEICKRLRIPERDGRYVLEQGFVPKGIGKTPRSGNHRQFDSAQAFWLALVLKLKESGIPVPLAATMVDHGLQVLKVVTQNLNWDSRFLPSAGRFDTDRQYFLEIGDKKYVRLMTDANPSGGGQLEALPWRDANDARKVVGNQNPYLVMRLDLTRVAHDLASAFAVRSGLSEEESA